MKKLFVFLTLLSATTILSVQAHADTVSTFTLHATNYNSSLDGFVNIDTTLGIPEYGMFTLIISLDPGVLPPQLITIAGDFGPASCADCFDYPDNRFFGLAQGDDSLVLQTPNSLIGYTGGPLCYTLTYVYGGCDGVGEGSEFVGTALRMGANGPIQVPIYVTFPGADLVMTPEPSTFVLLGTGGFGLLGLARRYLHN